MKADKREKMLLEAGREYALDNPDLDNGGLADAAYDLAQATFDCEGWSTAGHAVEAAADVVYTGMLRAREDR